MRVVARLADKAERHLTNGLALHYAAAVEPAPHPPFLHLAAFVRG